MLFVRPCGAWLDRWSPALREIREGMTTLVFARGISEMSSGLHFISPTRVAGCEVGLAVWTEELSLPFPTSAAQGKAPRPLLGAPRSGMQQGEGAVLTSGA